MEILCIGLNHETAPVSVREKLALKDSSLEKSLQWLKAYPGILEALILSTCNRVEFYLAVKKDAFQKDLLLQKLFTQRLELQEEGWEQFLYQHSNHKAVSHLFSVTSGMDSMVLGEPQITGQVKDAYQKASSQKAVGTILNRLLNKSFFVSKRVRTETELAARAVSVSYVAVELAKKIFGDLSDRTALLAGAGEMAELAARHLASHGISQILVASRTMESARKLANTFQGKAVRFDSLSQDLVQVDILICSMAASTYILQAEQIREVMRARKQKPVFIIDMAVPRNMDPRADDLKNVYLYDMDDLQNVLNTNLAERKKELKKAEIIVQEEVRDFLSWLSNLDLVPTIVSLRERAEEIRKQELEKAFSLLKTSLSDKQKKTIEAMSQAIVNKILHDPIHQIKQAEKQGEEAQLVAALQQLFSIDPIKDKECKGC